jgi:hypothetical protein
MSDEMHDQAPAAPEASETPAAPETAPETTPEASETPAAPETAPETSEAALAWRAVVAELDALGEAIGRWANAAVRDPDNKRRLDELSARFDGLVSDVGTTVKGAADSEVGQSFKEAADKTGVAFRTAGEKISGEVSPKLAGAFKTMGDKLREAAEKLEERAASTETASGAPATPVDVSVSEPAEPGPGD